MEEYGLRYEGPIYRPPSEANSLLVQATVGCPHNKCTFCMVYKRAPRFRIRPVEDIKEDLRRARMALGDGVRTAFFPAGNTIAMRTDDLAEIFRYTRELFPGVERITIYGSAQYICKKGRDGMRKLAEAGRITKVAGIELSEYVILGIGGRERTKEHIAATVDVLNRIDPHFIRLRTFLPKINTPLLEDIEAGRFQVLSPHEVMRETRDLIAGLEVTSKITSDHYTNYADVHGRLPKDRDEMLVAVEEALKLAESRFRPVYVGWQ